MSSKVIALVGGATLVAADPTIKIGLSGSGSDELRRVLDAAGQRQAGIANSGGLDAAYSAALSAAKAEIESVISAHMGGSSFLQQSVRVKVASGPGIGGDALRAVENYEAQGELNASRQMDTAAAEFSQLGNAVVNQLERALSEYFPKSSFLAAPGEAEGLGPVANVQITAGAFPTIANLVAMQGSPNVEGAIMDKMTSFVRDLNGIIAASLNSHSFLSRQANLKDVAAIAQAGVQESQEFLKAANELPSASEQVAEVERLSAMDASTAQASAGESDAIQGACLRDYSKPGAPCYANSFIQTGLNPAEIALKYLSARTSGDNSNARYSRPTQSPMVWMHYHHN